MIVPREKKKRLTKKTQRKLVVGMPRICPGVELGGDSHTKWAECPQDKGDILAGQTGHIHGTVAHQMERCPAKILYVSLAFPFPEC